MENKVIKNYIMTHVGNLVTIAHIIAHQNNLTNIAHCCPYSAFYGSAKPYFGGQFGGQDFFLPFRRWWATTPSPTRVVHHVAHVIGGLI